MEEGTDGGGAGTHSKHAWWTLERSSRQLQGVGRRNSALPSVSHVEHQQMRHAGGTGPPEGQVAASACMLVFDGRKE
jgi:hypothetical protein